MKLEAMLQGQDFGEKELTNTLQKVLDNEPVTDPITAIIVNAWNNNGGADGEFDEESALMDLEYAKNQIDKAIRNL